MSDLDIILKKQVDTIALGIMGNVPGSEKIETFADPDEPKKQIIALAIKTVKAARSKQDALKRLAEL